MKSVHLDRNIRTRLLSQCIIEIHFPHYRDKKILSQRDRHIRSALHCLINNLTRVGMKDRDGLVIEAIAIPASPTASAAAKRHRFSSDFPSELNRKGCSCLLSG
jgi:hypothetical protein